MHKLILILLTAVAVFAADKQPRNDYWKETDVEIIHDGKLYALRTPENTISYHYSGTLEGIREKRKSFVITRNSQLDAENERNGFWKADGKWWRIVEKKPEADATNGWLIGISDDVTLSTISTYAEDYCSKKSCKTCNP
jgi:hypothetical protein